MVWEMKRRGENSTEEAEECLSAHKPLLDFLDLRFIERPSLKRSQFTSQERRKSYLGWNNRGNKRQVGR